jgi:hypothetical protein
MLYGSNLFRKDNPRWGISNAAETAKVPYAAADLLAVTASDWVRGLSGICVSWLIGLPRRVGARWYAVNDAEARWSGWQVIERYGGLGRQYRDARFEALSHGDRS